MSAANPRILDQGFRDRGEHLADDVAVFLPERRDVAPSVGDTMVRLHQAKYNCPFVVSKGFAMRAGIARATG